MLPNIILLYDEEAQTQTLSMYIPTTKNKRITRESVRDGIEKSECVWCSQAYSHLRQYSDINPNALYPKYVVNHE